MVIARIRQHIRRLRLANRGVDLGPNCFIAPMVSVGGHPAVHPPGALVIGPECELSQGVELNPWGGHIRIGRHVFLGPYSVIYGHGGVEIGDQTLIAMHCCIVSSNHTVPGPEEQMRDLPDILQPTRIGRDVWLGAGVKVMGGVTIGNGCVVGAGSVVTQDLPPYAIAVGVPARVIGQRN